MRIRAIISTLCIAAVSAAGPVAGKPGASPDYQTLAPVIRDKSLDKMTKISRIGEFFKDDPNCHQALMWVAQVDEMVAERRVQREFKNPKRNQQEKLKIGRTLLTDARFNGDKQFIDDYAPWLVDQVIAQKPILKNVLPEGQLTAIGEYANIANSFQGHRFGNFSKIKDRRVVPVLVSALKMPDNVFPEHQPGCIVRGKPGEATGRNLDRQNVPVALARLGATDAVPSLRRTLESHHDWNFRDNSALALGMLLNPAQRQELVDWMKRRKSDDHKLDRHHHLFAFGKGLLNRGDDAGVEFMDFRYSIYYNEPKLSEVTYMFEQRLNLIKDLRSKKLADFYQQAFEHEPLMYAILFDKQNVQINDYGHTNCDLSKAELRIVKMFDQVATSIEKNKLTQLVLRLKKISKDSQNEAIRSRAKKCLATTSR